MRFSHMMVSLLALIVAPAYAGQVYRWVDQSGHVTYQDTPPPPDARDVRVERLTQSDSHGSVAHPPIVLYMIPHCQPCDSVREFLEKRAVPFSEINVDKHPKQRAAMQKKTGYASVPTVTIGKTVMNGFDPSWLSSTLNHAGYPKAPPHHP